MLALIQFQFIIFAILGIGCFVRKKGMVIREGQKNLYTFFKADHICRFVPARAEIRGFG